MNEPHRSVVVDQVNWSGILLISRIPRALALSFQPSRVIMGFVIVVMLMASGTIWDGLAGKQVGPGGLGSPPMADPALRDDLRLLLADPALIRTDRAEALRSAEVLSAADVRAAVLETYREKSLEDQQRDRVVVAEALARLKLVAPKGVFEATAEAVVARCHGVLNAALHLHLGGIADELAAAARMIGILLDEYLLFTIVFGLWTLVIGMIGVATISRTAACQFAIEQYITWTTALAYALKRWIPVLGTIGLPLVALALGTIALAVGGLLLAVPGLNVIGGVLYGLALFGGTIAACLILLTLLASALFIPAVAVESADAPDALARGFSFVRNRPLHWIVYVIAAFIQGVFGLLIVTLVASLALNFTAWGASLFVTSPAVEAVGGGASIDHLLPLSEGWSLSGTQRITGGLLVLWRTVVGGMVAGWVVSYFACATTVLYFLMRKATDDQDLEEIWQPGLIEGTMAPGRASVVDAGEAS